MTSYNMVLTPDFFGVVKRGAFDHWQGETVPLRGPNRDIIGEATIKDVDHREDGNVYIVVESAIDMNYHVSARVAAYIRGPNPMSFAIHENVTIPHQPKRDDDVARWIKTVRDRYAHDMWDSENIVDMPFYDAIDAILDEYRARADYGLTLDDDLSQLPDGW